MPACIRHVFSVSRSAKLTYKSTTVRTGFIVISLMAIVLLGCVLERHARVTKEMAWECLPSERDARYPEAEPVMFRYTEDPEYYDLASGRGLCQQLRASGKSTAKVTYDVWGTASRARGHRIELVNGLPLQDIGGPARSGYHGMRNRPHPLKSALQ
jgi:hypothetical protein